MKKSVIIAIIGSIVIILGFSLILFFRVTCIDSNEQCEGKPDGTGCTSGIWCGLFGRVCGGQSCVGIGLGKCLQGKCKPIGLLAQEVTITTDKTEYEQGENVETEIISSKVEPIYVSFRDTIPIIEQFENGVWNKIIHYCSNICDCIDKKLMCVQVTPPEFFYSEFKNPFVYKWNQTKCVYENKICGNDTYEIGMLKFVSGGKFKVKFCYWDENDVDITTDYAPPDKKKCVEKEFTIK